MREYYAAIDIGASSGRLILGRLGSSGVELYEVHRFKNAAVKRGGRLCWDVERLFDEIVSGLKKCADLGKIPVSLGVDTWGVDFALIGKDGEITGDCVCYRDPRTAGVDALVAKRMSEAELYAQTGIAKQTFNTIYQLAAIKRDEPQTLKKAERILMFPSYISYLLTGEGVNEYTECSTSALINAETRRWDEDVLRAAGLPSRLFGEIALPGTFIGNFTEAVKTRVGFDCRVMAVCSHDTASAVLAAPLDDDALFLSSGTWSLLGAELKKPVLSEESRVSGLTNEGGYGGTYRYLKNIMGLWIIQNVRREAGEDVTFPQLAELAAASSGFTSRINVDDARFFAPTDMTAEIKSACADLGQPAPQTLGELTFCVYASLAESYARTCAQIERLTGRKYGKIAIVGGGCQDAFLNRLTAEVSGRTVTAGPAEATALGNITAQMIASGEMEAPRRYKKLTEGKQ